MITDLFISSLTVLKRSKWSFKMTPIANKIFSPLGFVDKMS